MRSVLSLSAISIIVTACGAADDTDPVMGWDPPPLAWEACGEADGPRASEMECATLSVPVDWSDPGGTELSLNLARLPAGEPQSRQGVVIVLSGGPGGSGIEDLADAAAGLPEVRRRFDLVAHEPRTFLALRSLPQSCRQSPGAALGLPSDEADYERMLEPVLEGVERCRAEDASGLIDHLDGLSQGVDVEAIRRALNEERVSFTAQSYGSVVVAAYARLFPDRIRAAFVDGGESHPDAPNAADSGVAVRVFARFVAWCDAAAECAFGDGDAARAWGELTDRANRSPIPATSDRFGQVALSGLHLQFLTPGWLAPGNDNENWVRLSEDMKRAQMGDASAFADFSLGNLDQWARPSWIAMYCPDGRSAAPGYDAFMEVVDRRRRSAPHTYGRVQMGIVCGAWRVPIANPPAPLPGDELPAFLGAGTADNDFAPTEQFLANVPGSVTIAVEGAGHVVYLPGLGPANRCVLHHLSRYLIELALPSPGTRCAAELAEGAGA